MSAQTREHILIIVAFTLIFLVAGGFLLLYIKLYNERKWRHHKETISLREAFDNELTRTRTEVQEQTLQTIASDIHDNIGQVLSLVRMTLSSIDTGNTVNTEKKVGEALDLTEDAIRDLRQLASVLHAQNLLAEGLEHAVRKEVARVRRAGALQASVHSAGVPRALPPEQALIAFRLLQELLNNSMKHAAATEVRVGFSYDAAHVDIEVADNGRGFDVDAARAATRGLGLGNLYRRASLIGGQLQLSSTPGAGTRASLSIPYQNQNPV